MAGFDPAAATAAYIAEVPPAIRQAAEQHAQTAVIAWMLGWTGALVLALLMLRSGLVERIWRWGGGKGSPAAGLMVVALLALVSSGWELAVRAIAAHAIPQGAATAFCVDVVVRMIMLCGLWGLLKVAGRRPRVALGGVAVAASFLLVFGPVAVSELGGAAAHSASGPAAEAALALARASGVKAEAVEVSPASQTEGDVVGLLKPPRVVLAPEAVSESSVAEVRAAVGHVLGHYRARDGLAWAGTLAALGVLGGLFLAGLYGPAAQVMGAAATKRWNGAGLADVRGLPVVWALMSMWLALAQPAAFAFDRAINLRADRFSLEHAHEPDGLAQALIKGNGLQPVDPTPVELWLTCSHPALKDRIGRAMRWKAAQAETRTAAR